MAQVVILAHALRDAARIWRRPLAVAAAIAVGAIALVALSQVARQIDAAQIATALSALPAWRIGAALALTAASHLLLTSYDVLGLHYVGARLPWTTAARASFTSYTLSHNLGFSPVTGGSARLRIYGSAGVGAADVARIVVLSGTAFWTGVGFVAGFSLLTHPASLPVGNAQVPGWIVQIAGAALLALLVAVPLLARTRADARTAIARFMPLPGLPTMVLLAATAALDISFASLALFVLLPGLPIDVFPQVYLAYALAIIAGLVTHVPGGLGVFEAVFVASLPRSPALPATEVLAALVAYRAIYYLLPLCLSLSLNALIEARALKSTLTRAAGMAHGVLAEVGPFAFALLAFGGGTVLLLSGATPTIDTRMSLLREFLPLPFIEASHLSASLVGTLLLLVAPALGARLKSGMRTARLLFLLGAGFSLAKGLDYEEASVMLLLAGMLHLAAPSFYRKTQGAFSTHSRGWLAAALASVIVAATSGMLAYHQLAYDNQLWWQFALDGDAPRYLRATFATGVLAAAFALRELLGQPLLDGGLKALPAGAFERAVRSCSRSDAALAFTGDKHFLVSPEGDAFVMFRPRGRSWIVMGDPIGPQARWRDLIWDLRLQSDRCHASLCFYQISEAMLPLVVELGLKPAKYGEEAHLDLPSFGLDGPAMKRLRNGHARALREGLTLHVVPAGAVPLWFERVRAVSNAWLKDRRTREKTFSLGPCTLDYLRHFDLALVLAGDGDEVVAFANIWRSGDAAESSVDLMRYVPGAPPGTMDFLLVELALRARAQGCQRFNLGMAPLSGVRGGKLAPIWARLANAAFGVEGFGYNFSGLRRYKEKFAPLWVSRYVAAPDGWRGPRCLVDLVTLIGV